MRCGDVFDLVSARRVLAAAAQLSQGTVRVDLRGAREIHDVALAVIASARPRVIVVGLSRHHERLLQYLAARGSGGGEDEQGMPDEWRGGATWSSI